MLMMGQIFVLPAEALREMQRGGQAVANSSTTTADVQYATSKFTFWTYTCS